jgi:hypothetical protein
MTGDTFFEIPEDGNWNFAWNLFWNDPKSRQRLNSHKPFQVFSCWNGATAFTANALEDQIPPSSREGVLPRGAKVILQGHVVSWIWEDSGSAKRQS